jgi:Mg2+ and Co2+ transporter CorA
VVLRKWTDASARFEPFVMTDSAPPTSKVTWVDAADADVTVLSEVARSLGFPDAAIAWLHDEKRSAHARVVDGVIVCGIESSADGNDDATTLVVTCARHTLTAHSTDDGLVDEAAAVDANESERAAGYPGVLAIVDGLLERFDALVERLGHEHEGYHAMVLTRARGKQSSDDVIADGLRLGGVVNAVQRRLRRVEEMLVTLRRNAADTDFAAHELAAIDARTQRIDGLRSDLESLNHRLELATDARMNLIAARQNEINKAIGAWGGIFAVNAVITGWYGMNISDLPGSGSWVTVAVVMAAATLALIVLFKRVDWL